MNLVTLQTNFSQGFLQNLVELKKLIINIEDNSLILASELALSGYSYDKLHDASLFSKIACEELKKLSNKKILVLTMITKENNNYFNTLFVFYKNKIVHQQNKHKVFVLNDELKYFTKGKEEEISIFQIEGLKIAALICFELRFTNLWQKIKGADIILVPAMWGAKRKSHFEALNKALAISNQAYVLAANSSHQSCCKSSAIYSSIGEQIKDDRKVVLKSFVNFEEMKEFREIINTGLAKKD